MAMVGMHLWQLVFTLPCVWPAVINVNFGYFKEPAGHLWTYGVDAHSWTDPQTGSEYKYTYWPQTSGGKVIEKLQTGELDIAHLGNAPWGAGATRGTPAKMIYVIHSKDMSQVMVSRQGIRSPTQLVGSRLAYVQGSTTHYMLQGLMEQTRLSGEDFDFLGPLGQGDQKAKWDRGEIDAGYMWGGNMRYLQENGWCTDKDPKVQAACRSRAPDDIGLTGYDLFTGGMSKRWGKETWNNLVVSDKFAAAHPSTVFRSVKVIATMDTKLVHDKGFFTSDPKRMCGLAIATQLGCDASGIDYIRRALSFDVWMDHTTQQSGEYVGEKVPGQCDKEAIGDNPKNDGFCTKDTMSGSAWSTWATAEFGYKLKTSAYLPSYKYYQSMMDASYIQAVGSTSDKFPNITADTLASLDYYTLDADNVDQYCQDLPQPIALTSPGVFSDHASVGLQPSFYSEAGSCTWTIDQTQPVLLSDIDVRIERDQDTVNIYEGICVANVCDSYPLIATFTGGKGMSSLTLTNINPRPPLLIPSGKVTIIFKPDGTIDRPLAVVVNDGISMEWSLSSGSSCGGVSCSNGGTCVDNACKCIGGYSGADCSSTSCLGTLSLTATVSRQTISNGVPGTMTAHDADCRWVLKADQPDKVVVVEFVSLDVDYVYDPIQFFEGDGLSGPKLGEYSGYFTPKLNKVVGDRCPGTMCPGAVKSMGQSMTVRWSSDSIDSGTGFELKYFSADASSVKCGTGSLESCSKHGTCGVSGCICNPGWYGMFCQVPQCVGVSLVASAAAGSIRNMAADLPYYAPKRDCSWVLSPPANSMAVDSGSMSFFFSRFDLESFSGSKDEVVIRGPKSEVVLTGSALPCVVGATCVADTDCPRGGSCSKTGTCACAPLVLLGRDITVEFNTDSNNFPPGINNVGFVLDYSGIYDCPRNSTTGLCVALDRCSDIGMVNETSECHACSTCQPCPANTTYFDKVTKTCRCRRGLELDMATGQCSFCSLGKFRDRSAQCEECTAGGFGGAEGLIACELCALGSFTSASGQSSCTGCPGDLTTGYPGASADASCECPEGSYRDAMQRSKCVPCLQGMTCPHGSDEVNFGSTGAIPLLMSGYHSEWAAPLSVYRCRTRKECPGGSPGTCNEGRGGLGCGNCFENHYTHAAGYCLSCEGIDHLPFVLIIGLGFAALGPLYIYAGTDVSKQSLTTATAALTMGQLACAVQALGVFNEIDIDWSAENVNVLSIFKLVAFDLDAVKVQCILKQDNPLTHLLVTLILFPVFMATLAGVVVLRHAAGKRGLSFDRYLNSVGLVSLIVYISVTIAVLRPLHCITSPNGSSSMYTNPSVICWDSSNHVVLVGLSIFGLLLYPIAILANIGRVTWMYPALVSSGKGLQLLGRYRFLFHRFGQKTYFWGFFYLLRNFLTSLIPVLFRESAIWQVLSIEFIHLLALLGTCYLMPWRTLIANISEMGMAVALITFMQVASFFVHDDQGEGTELLAGVLIALVASIASVALGVLAHTAFFRFVPTTPYGVFLCYHQDGAASLGRYFKMIIGRLSSSRIFLHSDQMEELDLIFDTVRQKSKNLVILLTKMTLTLPWCAGEITTAVLNGVPIVPVICSDYVAPDEEARTQLDSLWSQQQLYQLGAYGVYLRSIKEAYRVLVDLEGILFERFAPARTQNAAIAKLVERCALPLLDSGSGSADGSEAAQIVIVGSAGDAEDHCTCEVLCLMVRAKVDIAVSVVHSAVEAVPHLATHTYLLVMLTKGLLQDSIFIDCLRMFDIQAEPAGIVTILADSRFAYPGAEFYQNLEKMGPQGAQSAAQFRLLLQILAIPFSPQGSEAVMGTQASEICRRFEPSSSIQSRLNIRVQV